MQGDCFELHDHIGEPTGLFAAGGGLDEVQQGRPAHEAVERRVGLVKNGPQMLVRVFVPPMAAAPRARCAVASSGPPFRASSARSGSARKDSMSASVPRNAVARAPISSPVSPY